LVISDNLTTTFAVVRAYGAHMSSGGSVVLISSAVVMIGIANHEAIAAAKAGIIGLAMSTSATYASNNLRFNVVAPSLTDTDLTKSITSNIDSLKYSIAMHALGRIGKPEEIANTVVFFLSPENDWITGQVLAIDGGLSRVRPKMKL
jgi:NAD(P)-dependent dehydrogenase (short-subunit alcohol dehydrogenase family)